MFFKKSDKIAYLNHAEALIIWGLRKVSGCSLYCMTIEHEFRKSFLDDFKDAINYFRDFAQELSTGRREIRIGFLDSPLLSRDEASILEMFYAASIDDDYLMDAHASWILGKNTDGECNLSQGCKLLTKCMLENGFHFQKRCFNQNSIKPIVIEAEKKRLRLI